MLQTEPHNQHHAEDQALVCRHEALKKRNRQAQVESCREQRILCWLQRLQLVLYSFGYDKLHLLLQKRHRLRKQEEAQYSRSIFDGMAQDLTDAAQRINTLLQDNQSLQTQLMKHRTHDGTATATTCCATSSFNQAVAVLGHWVSTGDCQMQNTLRAHVLSSSTLSCRDFDNDTYLCAPDNHSCLGVTARNHNS